MKKIAALLIGIGVTGIVQGVSSVKEQGESRPNIVFFLADDQSKFDHSAYGNEKAPTPTTQTFSEEGMVFERMYTGQACGVRKLIHGDNDWKHGVKLN